MILSLVRVASTSELTASKYLSLSYAHKLSARGTSERTSLLLVLAIGASVGGLTGRAGVSSKLIHEVGDAQEVDQHQ